MSNSLFAVCRLQRLAEEHDAIAIDDAEHARTRGSERLQAQRVGLGALRARN